MPEQIRLTEFRIIMKIIYDRCVCDTVHRLSVISRIMYSIGDHDSSISELQDDKEFLSDNALIPVDIRDRNLAPM